MACMPEIAPRALRPHNELRSGLFSSEIRAEIRSIVVTHAESLADFLLGGKYGVIRQRPSRVPRHDGCVVAAQEKTKNPNCIAVV